MDSPVYPRSGDHTDARMGTYRFHVDHYKNPFDGVTTPVTNRCQ